jgi:hypothetical protein
MKPTIPPTKPYVLPNRRAFADFVTRTFLKYREKTEKDLDEDEDDLLAKSPEGGHHTLMKYQQLVRDYMAEETPYDGLLVDHGLGSGKTFEAIALGLSLLHNKPVYVLLPASLRTNFNKEILDKGRPLYAYDHHWTYYAYGNDTDLQARAKELLNLPDSYIESHTGVWLSDSQKESNFSELNATQKNQVLEQVAALLSQRFKFFHYNNTSWDTRELLDVDPADGVTIRKNIFSHSVVIIDEAHKFIAAVRNGSKYLTPVYNAIMQAKDCKKVFLSGTPVVNNVTELAWLFNVLRGRIETFYITPPAVGLSITPDAAKVILNAVPSLDTVDYNAQKRKWVVTRNPQHFVNVYDACGAKLAVRFDAKANKEETAAEYADTLRGILERKGWETEPSDIHIEGSLLFPTEYKEFMSLFVDAATLKVKNEGLFMRRVQGLISYFKGVDRSLLPQRIDTEDTLVKVTMSQVQWLDYQRVRREEITQEANNAKHKSASSEDEKGNYRTKSRMVCNYALPAELRDKWEADMAQDHDAESAELKGELVQHMIEHSDQYFSKQALEKYSPKLLQIVNSVLDENSLHLVYSNFLAAEGIGFLGEALRVAGLRKFEVKKEGGQFHLAGAAAGGGSRTPYYGVFSGNDKADEREIARMVFSSEWEGLSSKYPFVLAELKREFGGNLDNLHGDVMKAFLITAAGAAGINLRNVRHVHIMEPYWNTAMMDQAIGRAIRMNSHQALPPEERTVKANIYLTVFNSSIHKASEDNAALIRKMDTIAKRFVQEFSPGEAVPVEVATTDEIIYNKAYLKKVLSSQFDDLLHRAAVDCEIHKPLHARDKPQLHCFRFDSAVQAEDIAFTPTIETDATDAEMAMNKQVAQRQLQKIRIRHLVYVLDPVAGVVYDWRIFDASQRLIRVGRIEEDAEGKALVLE